MRLSDSQSEWEVITALLIGPSNYCRQRLTMTLSSIHFSDPYFQRVFLSVCEEVRESGPDNNKNGDGFSIVGVFERLRAKSKAPEKEWDRFAEFIGSGHYGVRCSRVPGLVRMEKLLHECALARGMVAIGHELMEYERFTGDPIEFLQAKIAHFEKQTRLMDVDEPDLMDHFEQLCDDGASTHLTTGVEFFDDVGAIFRGCNAVLSASTSGGKSALAIQCAASAALRGLHVGYFSLEMNNRELLQRAIQTRLGKSKEAAKEKTYENGELVMQLQPTFHLFGNSTSWTMKEIHAKCATLKEKDGLDIVVIDHFGLVSSSAPSAYEQANEKSSFARKLGPELDVAVLSLWQFNRSQDGRPTLRSIRDSGKVAEDATSVMFLHAETDDRKLSSQPTSVYYEKLRNGAKQSWNATFNKPIQRFETEVESMAAAARTGSFDDWNA